MRAALDCAERGHGAGVDVDPKDKREIIERYRRAVRARRKSELAEAIALLEGIVRDEPQMVEVWNELARVAARVDRFGIGRRRVQARRRAHAIGSVAVAGSGGGAATTQQARRGAAAGASRCRWRVRRRHARRQRTQLLARIALARRDPDGARHEAALAVQADPSLPMAAYVEGRLLYDHGRFSEALPFFEEAVAALAKHPARQDRRPALLRRGHAGPAGTPLRGRGRVRRAVAHRPAPCAGPRWPGHGVREDREDRRSRTGRHRHVRLSPTPDAYALAARIWRALGKPRQAEAVRAEARKTFARPRPARTVSSQSRREIAGSREPHPRLPTQTFSGFLGHLVPYAKRQSRTPLKAESERRPAACGRRGLHR